MYEQGLTQRDATLDRARGIAAAEQQANAVRVTSNAVGETQIERLANVVAELRQAASMAEIQAMGQVDALCGRTGRPGQAEEQDKVSPDGIIEALYRQAVDALGHVRGIQSELERLAAAGVRTD